MVTVKIDTPGLDNIRQALASGPGNSLVDKMLSQWALRFRAWAQERYIDEGDYEWEELADSTVAAKERHGSRHPTSVLRDFDFLFHSLDAIFTGRDGQYERKYDLGVEVGIGGSATHPDSTLTLGEIASIHHMGEGDLPQRRILEEPPSSIVQEMLSDAQRIIYELGND